MESEVTKYAYLHDHDGFAYARLQMWKGPIHYSGTESHNYL